jgi:uncharacterized protein (DUF488 family)
VSKDLLVHTIGHSDHDIRVFTRLLQGFEIALLVDVRSQPYSRWAPQFNREILARDLQEAGISYQFMGDTLGGRPTDPDMYDPGEERPNYERMEGTTVYQSGIERLLELAEAERVTLMCSEGDPNQCHRHLLITQTLLDRGVQVLHIQPDGTTVRGGRIPRQLSLFG